MNHADLGLVGQSDLVTSFGIGVGRRDRSRGGLLSGNRHDDRALGAGRCIDLVVELRGIVVGELQIAECERTVPSLGRLGYVVAAEMAVLTIGREEDVAVADLEQDSEAELFDFVTHEFAVLEPVGKLAARQRILKRRLRLRLLARERRTDGGTGIPIRQGNFGGFWAADVTPNLRVIIRFEGQDDTDVDPRNCHKGRVLWR